MKGADLLIVALENEGVTQIFGVPRYGMIRWKQAVDGFADFGMTFGNPDFAAYARAYGAKGSFVETADGLASALDAAFADGGVHLVAVPVDYSENMRVLVDELRSHQRPN